MYELMECDHSISVVMHACAHTFSVFSQTKSEDNVVEIYFRFINLFWHFDV